MNLVLGTLASFAAIQVGQAAYVLTHAAVGSALGARVRACSLGIGPSVARRVWGNTEYHLSLLPLGGYTKFYGDIEDGQEALHGGGAAPSFHDLSFRSQTLTMLAGPIVVMVLGVLLLCVATLVPGSALSISHQSSTPVTPSGVPDLAFVGSRASVHSQIILLRDIAGSALDTIRFRAPIRDWSGLLGWLITCAAAARELGSWLTALGIFTFILGAANLLPIPTFVGGQIAILALRRTGADPSWKIGARLNAAGVATVLIGLVFLAYRDIAWCLARL